MAEQAKRIALVTGAAGGMGSACAERLRQDFSLFLTDIDRIRLETLTAELSDAGAGIAGVLACDLAERGAARRLIAAATDAGRIGAVVHTAGLSPSMGHADQLMRINAIATCALLDELEAHLNPGTAAVVIASMAGHFAAPDAVIDALCTAPSNDNFLAEVIPHLDRRASGREGSDAAYLYSKRANLLDVQRRARGWAAKGARINSISPGLVDTGMGRREVERDEASARMLESQLLGWVSAADIADAAAFLVSSASRTITGTDLKVDGGVCAVFFGGRTTTGACAA